jgi:hypothetical protein
MWGMSTGLPQIAVRDAVDSSRIATALMVPVLSSFTASRA